MPHDLLQALAIFAAGLAAGTINTVVGSGTLITFPTLLAFGYPPVLANVSNNVGLVPGVASGVYGYRSELGGQRRRLIRLGSASVCGGLVGAILLLDAPAERVQGHRAGADRAGRGDGHHPAPAGEVGGRAAAGAGGRGDAGRRGRGRRGSGRERRRCEPRRRECRWCERRTVRAPVAVADPPAAAEAIGGPVLWVLVFLAGIYGGYFGAAQGVLLIGMLGIALNDSLQRINAAKNVLAGLVNGLAAVVFILATHVDWGVAGLIAAGSIIGGQVGARIGKRLPPWGLRVVIVCVGTAALIKLLA